MPASPLHRLVIATHNQGKLREFVNLLSPYIGQIVSAGQLGLMAPAETGTSCVENAVLKVDAVAAALGTTTDLILADDSGFFVNVLGGNPGVYAADWINPDAAAAMKRVYDEMGNAADRSAYFLCVLALCWPDGHIDIIEGRIDGNIAKEPRGTFGHGYDPIFVPNGETRTFGEMSEEEKNKISHRGLATRKLIDNFLISLKV